MTAIITAEFHGHTLFLAEHNGQPYAAMKSIVEGMGLAWQSQLEKLRGNAERWGITEIVMPSQGGSQATICMPLRKLPGWLMTIHPNKVKDETVRVRVIAYQNECDDVLWRYWSEGHTTAPGYRPEQTRDVHALGLTREQQDTIKAHHKALVESAPKEKQAKLAITLWSSIKSKFGVSYKDVPPSDFGNVISLMSRVAIEGDWLPAANVQAGYLLGEREAAALHNVLLCMDMMRDTLKQLEPPLRQLGSSLAGRVYDGWHEVGLALPSIRHVRLYADHAYLQQMRGVSTRY